MIFLTIFMEFFKIGMFALGGGLATIPFLKQFIEKYDWFTEAELMNMIAISESTPGPLGVNMATFVGFKTAGIAGGLVATLGIITPSMIITTAVFRYFIKFKNNTRIDFVFHFLHPMVVGMMAVVVVYLINSSVINSDLFVQSGKIVDLFEFKQLGLLSLWLLAFTKFRPYPIVVLLLSGVCGVFL